MNGLKEKENDWLVSIALNKDLGLSDFSDMGLTKENTQLQDRNYYKGKKFIQDTFVKEDGSFDEDTFNKTYDVALKSFNTFTSDSFKSQKDPLLSQMEHTYSDVFKYDNSKLNTANFEVKKVKNPFLEKRGLQGLGSVEESRLSISEIAQKGKVIDYATGKTLDWSANDKGGFQGFNREALVLAQWDEEGTHMDPETGRMVKHAAGDYKYNSDGEICYETLGNRDASTKQFLGAFDTITEDGSFANKFDIFDADDKEQNIAKTVARAALKYAPVALGAIASGGVLPAISSVYLGATALMNLGEAIPGLYKAIEGVALGGDDDISKKGSLWHVMNSLESRMKQYRFGTSEYSQKNTFTMENFINLIGDVSLQLGQQTTIAQIPKYLGLDKRYVAGAKTIDEAQKKMLKFNDFSKNLATAYMTITSGTDAYGRAKEVGHSDRAAGLITLGTLFGLHKIMQSDIGQWPLKQIGLDDLRMAAKPILKEESENLAKAMGDKAASIVDEKGVNYIINKISNSVYKGLKAFIDDPSKLPAAALNEAIEEVSEEMVGDFNMAIGAAASALDVTRKVNTDFSWGDVAQRYAMAGFGGAIGGSIHNLRTPWSKAHKALENGQENYKLLNLVWENGADAVCDEIDREYKSNILVGDKNLSATKSEYKDNDLFYLTAENEQDSQAWAIKEGLKNLVRTYEQLLTKSGSINRDVDVRKALMNLQDPEIEALTKFGLENRVADHISYYNNKIIGVNQQLAELNETDRDFTVLNSRLAELQAQKESILNGEHFDHYFQQGMLWLNDEARNLFIKSNIDDFSVMKTGKKEKELSASEQKIIRSEYNDYVQDNRNMQLEYAVDILNKTTEKLSPTLLNYNDNYAKTRKKQFEVLNNSLDAAHNRLLAFDQNGEMIDAQKAFITDPNSNNGINILDFSLLNELDPNFDTLTPLQQKQYELNSIVQNIQLMTAGGIPLDGEIVEKVNNFRQDVINQINSFVYNGREQEEEEEGFKGGGNFQENDVVSQYHMNGITLGQLPIMQSILNNRGNSDLIDFDKLDEEVKNLELSDLENSDGIDLQELKDEMTSLEEYSNKSEDEISDEVALKYVKDKILIPHYNSLKQQTLSNNRIYYNFLNQTEEAIKSSISNPIYDYLNQISELTGSNNQKLFDVLKEESTRLTNMSIDDYLVNNQDKLELVKKDIQIARTLISMTTDSPIENTYGKVLNKFRKKYRSLPEIPLVNPEVSVLMSTDLNLLENKIDFLLKLSAYNAADRLREQNKSAAKFYTLFAEIYDTDPNSMGLLSRINQIHPDLNILEGIDDVFASNINDNVFDKLKEEVNTSSVNPETLKKAERLLTLLESQLHKNFNNILTSDNRLEVLKKLINPTVFSFDRNSQTSLVNDRTSDISSKTDNLTDFDKMIYLLSIASSDSLEYKYYLNKALSAKITDSEGNEVDKYPFAPLFAQEYPCRIAYGLANNTELFNDALSLMVNPETGKRYNAMLPNLMYIMGYHGTGKTSATANLIHSILKNKFGENYATITSIVDRQTKKFQKSLGVSEKTYTKNELLTEIFQGKDVSEFLAEGKTGIEEDCINYDKIKAVGNNANINKVIYIDEVTWYNSKELAVLTAWARENNRLIITLGDDLQQGASKNIQYFQTIKSPVIEYSMRAGSTIVKDNADTIRVITKQINNLDFEPKDRETIPSEFKKLWNKEIKNSVDSNGNFIGTKFVPSNSLDEVDNTLSKLIKNKINKDEIAVIYETDADYNKIKPLTEKYNIQTVKLSEMQGSEFDYVISLVNVDPPTGSNPPNYVAYVQKINTLLSRARLGNLILGDAKLKQVTASNNVLKFDEAKLLEFRNYKLDALTYTIGDYKPEGAVENESNVSTITEEQKQGDEPKRVIQQGGEDVENTIVKKEIESIVSGDIPVSEGSYDQSEEKGKSVNDGKLLGYSSFVSFGGVNKDGKINIGLSHKGLQFDLQMFRTSLDDSNVFGQMSLYDEEGNLNVKLLQTLDLLKKEILLNNKKIKDLRNDPEFKSLLTNDVCNNYDLSNAEFRVVYTKRDDNFDFNNELKNTYRNDSKLIKRLVLYLPSYTADEGGVLTLAELGSKPGDTHVSDFDKIAESKLIKGNDDFYMIHVPEESIKLSGIATRLIPKNDPEHKYSYDELIDDYSWKKVSKPMIFTGVPDYLTKLIKEGNDDEIANAVKNKVKEYNINGRPVMFVSKHPATKDWSDDKLAQAFWEQKVYYMKRDRGDKNLKEVPNYVNMVVLNTSSLSGEEFFEELENSLEAFKTDKSGAAKKINTISHKYLALRIIRNLHEYNQYCWDNYYKNKKWNFPDKKEEYKFRNNSGILKWLELVYGIGSKTVTINGNKETHLIFKTSGENDGKVIDPNDDETLNRVVSFINEGQREDSRKILYDYYYNDKKTKISENFNFSDLLVVLHDLTKDKSELYKSVDVDLGKNTIHTSYARQNMISILTESPVAKFPNGFEAHPIYKSDKNDNSGRTTNWVESCANETKDFNIDRLTIESQRVLVDFSKAMDLERKAENDKKVEKENNDFIVSTKNDISQLNLSPALTETLNKIVDNNPKEDVEEIINKTLENTQKSLLNNTESENPIISITYENGSFVTEAIKDLNSVKEVDKEIKSINTSGAKPEITFINEDGSEDIRTLEKDNTLKTVSNFGSIQQKIDESKTQTDKYNEDVNSFIQTLGDIKTFDLNLLGTVLALNSDAISFKDIAELSKHVFNHNESSYDKFKELMNKKLEIIC